MGVSFLFVNRHHEIRVGWRLVLFLIIVVPLIQLDLYASRKASLALVWFEVMMIVSVLLASFTSTRYFNRKPFTAIGLGLHPMLFREFGLGCVVGFAMMSGIFFVELGFGLVTFEWRGLQLNAISWVILTSGATFAVGAFSEEVLFRGYAFQTLIQGVTFLPATLILAVLFALAHAGNPNVSLFGFVNIALAAVWLSIAYMKTRSLWLPFGLHFSWNFAQTTVYAFPTSGVSFTEFKLFLLKQTGPEWLTGGVFGPEGGALATAALVGGTWYLLKSRQVSAPEGIVTLDSVEDLLAPLQNPAGLPVHQGGNGQGT